MKKLIVFLIVGLLFTACNSGKTGQPAAGSTDQKVAIPAANLVSLKFDVRGMTCTDCENTVTKGVNALEGIAEVKASFVDSFALVKFDKTKTNAEAIRKAIENKGYEVKGFTEVKD